MTEENKIKNETDKLSSFKGYGNWGPQVFSWDYNGEGSMIIPTKILPQKVAKGKNGVLIIFLINGLAKEWAPSPEVHPEKIL